MDALSEAPAAVESLERADTRLRAFLVDSSTAAGFSLRTYGQWQQSLIDFLTAQLACDARVVDLAAKTGYFAEALSHHVKEGAVMVRPHDDLEAHTADNLTVVRQVPDLGLCDLLRLDAAAMPAMSELPDAGPMVISEVTTVDEALAVLTPLGPEYACSVLRTPMFETDNFRGESTNYFGHGQQSWLVLTRRGELAPPTGSGSLIECPTIHELAQVILETPRFGDGGPDDRKPAGLLTALRHARAQLEQVSAQTEVLHDELKRAAYRESMLEKRVIRLTAQTAALQGQVTRLEVLEAALQEALEDLATAHEVLTGVRQSRSWQVTAPIRGFNERRRARRDDIP